MSPTRFNFSCRSCICARKLRVVDSFSWCCKCKFVCNDDGHYAMKHTQLHTGSSILSLRDVTNTLEPPYNIQLSQWRHNECDGISNHQRLHCLLNYFFFFGCRSKKTSKLHITGLCEGNLPLTGEFPAQRASNAENASIWCRHHVKTRYHISMMAYCKTDVTIELMQSCTEPLNDYNNNCVPERRLWTDKNT